jgi:hypothetical protein
MAACVAQEAWGPSQSRARLAPNDLSTGTELPYFVLHFHETNDHARGKSREEGGKEREQEGEQEG